MASRGTTSAPDVRTPAQRRIGETVTVEVSRHDTTRRALETELSRRKGTEDGALDLVKNRVQVTVLSSAVGDRNLVSDETPVTVRRREKLVRVAATKKQDEVC